MSRLIAWFDDRTGFRKILHDALYEHIPGGARWRYVWGSTLVFTFVTQVITGTALWMSYSPSSRTAWESVYYIQYEMQFGWLLRGIHHFTASAMVVLLALHLLQVVIAGAYRAPRELNFWLGLILMQIVLGLALTGYLLPWDQKGFWATAVATNLMSFVPFVGDRLQQIVVGGSEYGHHTLTRFFALHAGVLPGLLIAVLAAHIALFRKHGITAKPTHRPDHCFWPDQVLKDSIACLAVLAVILLLCFRGLFGGDHAGQLSGDYLGAELSAPADPSEQFSAARPEWYFLSLFQLLKYFTPETMGSEALGNEFVGAIVVPGLAMGFLFLIPLLGNWKLGRGFNLAMLIALLAGAGFLTARAWYTDHYAWFHTGAVTEQEAAAPAVDTAQAAGGPGTNTNGSDAGRAAALYLDAKQLKQSTEYLAAVEESRRNARRIKEVIRVRGGVPYEGAISLMSRDPELQAPKFFAQYCASCHSYLDKKGEGIKGPSPPPAHENGKTPPYGASNLYGFASRAWLRGFLDPVKIASDEYFGATAHFENEMVQFVQAKMPHLTDAGKEQLEALIAAVSAEAGLVYQAELDATARVEGTVEKGIAALSAALSSEGSVRKETCMECHTFRDDGIEIGPNLTGYGSEEWLVAMISDPEHFYSSNDRMPRFAPEDKPDKAILRSDQIHMLARWIRRDDRTVDEDTPWLRQ